MSYAIIRNEKLTRTEAKGSYVHNERRTRGHTNKDIDSEKTHFFDKIKKIKIYFEESYNFICSYKNLG